MHKVTAQRDKARAELKSLELGVTAAVWKAHHDFFSARKKYEASEALVAASEESYGANIESHQHGLAVITDLIGAERDLMAARYIPVQNKAELLVASSALVYAVGSESAVASSGTLNSRLVEKEQLLCQAVTSSVCSPA